MVNFTSWRRSVILPSPPTVAVVVVIVVVVASGSFVAELWERPN